MDLTNEHWDYFVANPTSCEWIVYGPLIAGCLSTQKKWEVGSYWLSGSKCDELQGVAAKADSVQLV
jgi:hypothetical protein